MLNDRRNQETKGILIPLLIAVIGLLGLAGTSVAVAQDYIGSEACSECHLDKYSNWKASGHPYKLMASEDARNRPIPLPAGLFWDDISWVIGGYKWKSRYIDNDGYIITVDENGPGNTQYNYFTHSWSDYHPGEVMKPYDCGGCHTTGWVFDDDAATDGDLTDNQGGLPGMHGTFAEGGIGCEACHGPGGMGPGGTGSHGFKDTSAELCGSCHIRGDSATIPASGGFIRHHEQYNSFLASPHKNMSCTSCHDPHKPSLSSIKEGRTCQDCHSSQTTAFENTEMFAAGVDCIDCHMPYASKSAQALGPFEGDLKTHLFWINTDADYEMFTPDGGFVNLDSSGNGATNLNFSCLRCHGNQTADWAEGYAVGFHSTDFRITPGISGTWVGPAGERDGEGWLLDMTSLFVAAMYTQDENGDQAWLIGPGVPNGNTVTVNLIQADGPVFGDMRMQSEMNETAWGTATFTFTSCGAGTVTFTPNAASLAQGYVAYTTTLSRLVGTEHSCPGTG